MAAGEVTTVVGLERVPGDVRSLAVLDRVDYADSYAAAVPGATSWTAEQWARGTMEQGAIGRSSARRLWRALGLRLGRRGSPEHVQGWRILDRDERWIRVQTSSWFLTAQAVVRVEPDRVCLALFLRFDRPVARAVWAPVAPMHQRAVPVMLRQAMAIHEQEASR